MSIRMKAYTRLGLYVTLSYTPLQPQNIHDKKMMCLSNITIYRKFILWLYCDSVNRALLCPQISQLGSYPSMVFHHSTPTDMLVPHQDLVAAAPLCLPLSWPNMLLSADAVTLHFCICVSVWWPSMTGLAVDNMPSYAVPCLTAGMSALSRASDNTKSCIPLANFLYQGYIIMYELRMVSTLALCDWYRWTTISILMLGAGMVL